MPCAQQRTVVPAVELTNQKVDLADFKSDLGLLGGHLVKRFCSLTACCLLAVVATVQEREEAAKLYGDGAATEAAAAGSSKTFEPGEGLPEAMEAEGAAAEEGDDSEMAAAAPKASAAPSAEQLTAIKAAIANAQTLEEVRALEAALQTGNLPSQFQFKGGGTNGEPANGDSAAAMEED